MSVLKTAFGLVKQIANPKNYGLFDDTQNRTEIDTLILDSSGRVKVDYGNEDVRRRVHEVLSDFKKFQLTETASSRHMQQE